MMKVDIHPSPCSNKAMVDSVLMFQVRRYLRVEPFKIKSSSTRLSLPIVGMAPRCCIHVYTYDDKDDNGKIVKIY